MATIRRFEDLIAWQKARQLTREIYIQTNQGDFSRDYGLRDQIQRASVSIMSNIAEGFERDSLNEYIRFVSIAKASCGEVRCQLYIALDVGYINQSLFEKLRQQTIEIARLFNGLKKSLEKHQ